MEKTTKTRRYYAGANTKYGFYNLFNQINRSDKAGFLYILKGGPGTGKSTLMKKIGKTFEGKTDVEYFYCSSDHESLDGVRLPTLNVAVVDGTAPHICETVIPGAREKIVDLGAFIGDCVKKHEKEITELMKQKRLFFDTAYLYIKNASNLFECNNLIFTAFYKDAAIVASKIARRILRDLGLNAANNGKNKRGAHGNVRRLFLSTIADGDFADFASQNNYNSIIELDYDPYLHGLVLKEIAEAAARRGFDVTCFCEILAPESFNSVLITHTDTLIIRKAEFAARDEKHEGTIQYNNNAIKDAVFAADNALNKAKEAHKKIEEFYILAMDFAGIEAVAPGIISVLSAQCATHNESRN
ncbi:MAG: hypothetical protein FWE84_00025 [Firmicutes bacterium]|nr:hypothetical protein [Bacillota bacterium]